MVSIRIFTGDVSKRIYGDFPYEICFGRVFSALSLQIEKDYEHESKTNARFDACHTTSPSMQI